MGKSGGQGWDVALLSAVEMVLWLGTPLFGRAVFIDVQRQVNPRTASRGAGGMVGTP